MGIISNALKKSASPVVGAAVGGTTGFFAGENQDFTNRLEGAVRGATLGAIGGLGAMGAAKVLANKNTYKTLGSMGLTAGSAGYSATKAGSKAAYWAAERPMTSLAIGGAAIGGGYTALTAGDYSSPTLSGAEVKSNYTEQMMMSEQMNTGISPQGTIGSAPEMMGRFSHAMQQSTTGLVFGLHKRRH